MPANGDGAIAIETDRGVISAPLVVDALGWRRMLASGDGYQPPDAPLSRGLEVHPEGSSEDLEVWIDRRYVPAGYGWSFPARDELRIGVGSFDPRFHVRETDRAAGRGPGTRPRPLPGQLDPAQAAPCHRGRRLLRRRLGRTLPAAHRGGNQDRALLRHRPRTRAARGPRRTAGSRAGGGSLRRVPRFARVEVPLDAARPAARAAHPTAPARPDDPPARLEALRRLVLQPLPADRAAGTNRPQRTIRSVPAISRTTPITRSGLSGTWSSPSRPSRSIATEAVSWPAIVAAATPPAPIDRDRDQGVGRRRPRRADRRAGNTN